MKVKRVIKRTKRCGFILHNKMFVGKYGVNEILSGIVVNPDANVLDTMTADGSGDTDADVIKVMGADSKMTLGFTATPTSGNNALEVQFTDTTNVDTINIADSMLGEGYDPGPI